MRDTFERRIAQAANGFAELLERLAHPLTGPEGPQLKYAKA
jgi:hypothetical protein